MKIFKFTLVLIAVLTISCQNEKTKKVNTKNTVNKVQHYICKNNCENSGSDVAGNCPVCNNQYLHNVAFHEKDLLKSGPLKIESNATNPSKAAAPTPTNIPSPAQNANGAYHYTCTNGCAGGAGTVTNCKSCGTTLVHNQLYHN